MVLNYCKDLDATHIHTSAKSGKGVADCFMSLTKAMLAQSMGKQKGGGKPGSKPKRTIKIDDTDETGEDQIPRAEKKERSCCK
ncbi:hypothetical protein DIPPA_28949 [Diplonema papillatum]|nr:hypothetical protein DIPPA_28949 [Diplonema papillatum]